MYASSQPAATAHSGNIDADPATRPAIGSNADISAAQVWGSLSTIFGLVIFIYLFDFQAYPKPQKVYLKRTNASSLKVSILCVFNISSFLSFFC